MSKYRNVPSGLGWLPDGRMLVVSMRDRKVMRLDPTAWSSTPTCRASPRSTATTWWSTRQGGPTSGTSASTSTRFLHEQGVEGALAEPGPPKATLARVEPDGTVHAAAPDMKFPNGSVITPDGTTLIVAETLGLRLTAFDIADDGSLSNRRMWADLGARPPDGICLDAEGHVWVANPLAPECFLVAEGGHVVAVVETDQPCFACMLGGPERRHLFMLTCPSSDPAIASAQREGHVMVAEVDVPGAGLP